MKIRKKLFLGFGLLFAVVMLLGIVSIYYISDISENSKVTLKNNYETLTFTKDMRTVLNENDLPLTSKAARAFDEALKKQENNITEPGEKEATAGVRMAFDTLIEAKLNPERQRPTAKKIRLLLNTIDELNMKAIVDKDARMRATVDHATLYLGVMAFITFLILFILIANFPGFIIKPLNQFADGLLEVSQKNYNARLDLKTSEEFAKLSSAFNTMAEKLGEQENATLTKFLTEEIRVSALIEETKNAVIGIDEKQKVLFMNSTAKNILGLNEKMVVGKTVSELTKTSNMLKTIVENEDLDSPVTVSIDGQLSYFKQKNIDIAAPNLDLSPSYGVRYAGFPAGMIIILKKVPENV